MTPKLISHLSPVLAALLLAGCVTPAFKQPQIETPTAFRESQAPSATSEVAGPEGSRWKPAQPAEQQPRGQWWLAFNDQALTALIEEATANNANLSVAAARVKQARAIAGIANADRLPQVGVGVDAQRARPSPLEAKLPEGTPTPGQTSYNASLTASWEIDLFGRLSAGVSAARGDAAATEANYRSVLLSLQADVAQTYFRLRALDAELDTVGETVRLREESVKLTQRRFDLGDIGEFDLSRARTELSNARAEAIGLQRQRATTEHQLAVLLGKPAANYVAGPSPLLDGALMPTIPAGMPSSLLERRPDIVAAQRTMEASNARIGVARGAMFPALSLNAAGGGVAGSFAEVFKWSSRSWVAGALLSMPLIDGGRNRNNVIRSEAALEESVGIYRQSVLNAFAEVEDNLAGLRILAGQGEQIDAALVSARRSADLAQKLYDAGRSSYLELLDAQRNLALVERSAVQLRGNRAVTTVALIRALGGGWDAPGAGQAVAAR
ncbi:RND transporter [Massilia sp. KIM]|uniref:efflux transporter outer membrane subunit n=1 Tax=Massilia sp. KIM TaxID=1955422 RepID=UPI00098EDC37|nr:efflux transporter outer membrane subunit [Massilia sp. KIM]OON60307.1 RND transporter [Massilia sp. KIM]